MTSENRQSDPSSARYSAYCPMPPPMPLLRSGSPYSFGSQPSAASSFPNAGRSASTRAGVSAISCGQPARFVDQRADLGHIDEKAEVFVIVMVMLAEVAHRDHQIATIGYETAEFLQLRFDRLHLLDQIRVALVRVAADRAGRPASPCAGCCSTG